MTKQQQHERVPAAVLVPSAHKAFVIRGISDLHTELHELQTELSGAFGASIPQPIAVREFLQNLEALGEAVPADRGLLENALVSESLASILKTAILARRKRLANEIASHRRKAFNDETLSAIDARLEPARFFQAQRWFAATSALRLPKKSDYLTLQYLHERANITTGEFDPKFGILFSTNYLSREFPRIHGECDSRGVPLAVMFLDVDDFKRINSEYGEPRVDRDLLPGLMRRLEAVFFGHGPAFRYGGDEFVVLLPNHSERSVAPLVADLRQSLKSATYGSIEAKPSVSIGLSVIDADSPLAEDEALERASAAKRIAKEGGKNRCAVWLDRDTTAELRDW